MSSIHHYGGASVAMLYKGQTDCRWPYRLIAVATVTIGSDASDHAAAEGEIQFLDGLADGHLVHT
jgi:hypothetical protein